MGATGRCDTVVGVFDTQDRAERAVAELHIAGYRDDQINTAAHGRDLESSPLRAGSTTA